MTIPVPLAFGLALIAISSPINNIACSKSSIPVVSLADTGITIVSPPHSSVVRPESDNCCFTLSKLAPVTSILLRATIIGTPAALACAIASLV